jgi:DNA-directed RNA polymerase omega subunit
MSVPIRSASKSARNDFSDIANEGLWPGIDSRFRLIIVAGLRTKQLLHGSHPRIEVDPLKRRNTSIALEEVKRGLVRFTVTAVEVNGGEMHRPLSGKSQA